MATYWNNSCSFGLLSVFMVYLIVSLFFSHLGFWSGSLFLIAPFPDLCLLVLLFYIFLTFVQYIDCGYTLESLRQGGFERVTTVFVLYENSEK